MSTLHPVTHVPGFTFEEVVSKIGFCEQLKGGVVMDVIDPEQARIAEELTWPQRKRVSINPY